MVAALPLSLLVLLFACPLVFAENEEQRSSPNDPFRALALQKPRLPQNPVCCLRPLSAPEPVDDGMLLSFEEWKMKQLASEAVPVPLPKLNTSNGTDLTDRLSADTPTEDSPTPADWDPQHHHDSPDLLLSQPQFRVPLTDRFNYASLDCSARVHTAHRSAKSPSSILSSKKDRYMLSPCDKSRESQFVVVELCDDIRIDTVQLANFEFFSGVFKDFTVSVSKTYSTSPSDWTVVATYRAKNVRGVQSFRWPSSSRDFYRFIRIDFLSHYGSEYYCPVSLLRVYGLTHLEEWKWEVWEAESRQRLVEAQRRGVLPFPATETANVVEAPAVLVESTVVSSGSQQSGQASSAQNTALPSPHANRSNLKAFVPENHSSQGPSIPSNEPISSNSAPSAPASHTTQSHSQNQNQIQAKEHHSTDTYASSQASSPSPSISVSGSAQSIPTQNIPSSTPSSSASTSSTSSVSQKASTASGSATAPNVNVSNTPSASPSPSETLSSTGSSTSTSVSSAAISSSDATGSTPTPTIVVSLPSPSPPAQQPPPASLSPSAPLPPSASTPVPIPQPPPIQHKPHLPPSSSGGGGESIYRTILNKLADVELNQTLHMRYVELQHARVREGLRRLGEDVGRLEGGTRAQSAKYQRTLDEWDRQRYQLEMEYGELISRIEYLSEEITLEKRLGVAQLLLLLAVLIFMGLTRGSRAETPSPTPAMTSNRQRLREWGRRHFRLSGDWDWRFGRKKESGSGTESDTRTERVPGPPRTPSPLPGGEGTAKRIKSGKHVPPRLPLDSRSSYDEDENPILYPSTSQPYISTRKPTGSRKQNQPLTPISLNALPTAPVSLPQSYSYSYSSSRSENRHTVRQRTSSNPRSRAPSLRSTPRRTHVHAQHPFARPVTPTSATFLQHQPIPVQLRPQMLQRSSSHGMGVGGVGMLPSASWGSVLGAGVGAVPKSARKWARTAHLHEVKSAAVGGGVKGRGKAKEKTTEQQGESGKEKDDVFSSSSSRVQSAEQQQQQRLSQALDSLLLKPDEALNGAEHEEDGDTWVDTDSVGGSELDVEAEVEVEVSEGHSVGLSPAAPAGSGGPSTSRSRDLVGSDSFVKPPLIPFPSA